VSSQKLKRRRRRRSKVSRRSKFTAIKEVFSRRDCSHFLRSEGSVSCLINHNFMSVVKIIEVLSIVAFYFGRGISSTLAKALMILALLVLVILAVRVLLFFLTLD